MHAAVWLESLAELGRSSVTWFWSPVLLWTVVASVALLLLSQLRRLHPLTGYRLRQALLLSLPAALLVTPWAPQLVRGPAPLTEWVSESAVAASSAGDGAASVALTVDPLGWALGLGVLLVVVSAVVGLAGLLRQLQHLRYLALLADRLEDPRASKVLDDLTARMGITRPVVLLAAPADSVPMTFQWVALYRAMSWISVPHDLCASPARLRLALAHELVHVRRADALWSLIERIVSAPFALHPLVRALRASITHFREASCDAEVVGTGAGEPRAYAELLLEMSRSARRVHALAPSLFTRTSNLKKRLRIMKRFIEIPTSRRLRTQSLVGAAVLFLSTAGATACGSRAEQASESAAQVAVQITSRFGAMEDETRDATLERLDVQMNYLNERIEAIQEELEAVDRSGGAVPQHVWRQQELLTSMYLERLETYETLKLDRETERLLGGGGQ